MSLGETPPTHATGAGITKEELAVTVLIIIVVVISIRYAYTTATAGLIVDVIALFIVTTLSDDNFCVLHFFTTDDTNRDLKYRVFMHGA
jgi:hypothetical protein